MLIALNLLPNSLILCAKKITIFCWNSFTGDHSKLYSNFVMGISRVGEQLQFKLSSYKCGKIVCLVVPFTKRTLHDCHPPFPKYLDSLTSSLVKGELTHNGSIVKALLSLKQCYYIYSHQCFRSCFLCNFAIQKRTAAAPGIFHLLPEYLEFLNWIAKMIPKISPFWEIRKSVGGNLIKILKIDSNRSLVFLVHREKAM
jgi:hypothetical protein